MLLQADAPDVGERLAVRADPRRDGAALDRHDRPLAPGIQVAPDDRVDGAVRILVVFELLPGRDVLAVIEIAAVGRHRRLARVLLESVLLGDLQAVGSRRVIHPDLARAERSLRDEMPPREDVAAVGGPRRAVDEPAPLARTCFAFFPSRSIVQMFQRPSRSLRERDAFAVGAEARLHVEGRSAGDACRLRGARASTGIV